MKIHVLKSWTSFFEAVVIGRKTFEHRLNDRDFQYGDFVVFEEWDHEKNKFTGRTYPRRGSGLRILYVLTDAKEFGLRDGFCAFGFDPHPIEFPLP